MGKVAALFAACLLLAFGCALPGAPSLGKYGSEHSHADFKLYIEGVPYDFSQEKYQEPSGVEGQETCGDDGKMADLHDGDGDVVHKHATGVTWGYFFSTLNMTLADSCFTLDNGTGYCNGNGKKWEYFVNGDAVSSVKDLEMHDLDQVLITYGATYEEAVRQQATVTSKSYNESTGGFC